MVSKPLLLLLAAATSALAQIFVSPGLGYFVLNTIAPTNESFVSYSSVSADAGKFWIGRPTAQTCTTFPEACAHLAPQTILGCNANSLTDGTTPPTSFSLATLSARDQAVQAVYVARDGTLSYTAPGEAVPQDAQVTAQFLYSPEAERTGYGSVVVDGRDFVACSADNGAGREWSVRNAPTGNELAAGCYVISMATRPYWQGVNVDFFNTTSS